MRLVTWNCARRNYLRKEVHEHLSALTPDILLIQEAPRNAATSSGLWIGGSRSFGLAVQTSHAFRLLGPVGEPRAPWSVAPVRVIAAHSFTLLAVWTKQGQGFHKAVDQALTYYSRSLRRSPCVVLGDFNANARWDDAPPRHDGFLHLKERLRNDFGLKSAYHTHTGQGFGKERRMTHVHRANGRSYHIDYCFVPNRWYVRDVQILSRSPWRSLSDHFPLVVDVLPRW